MLKFIRRLLGGRDKGSDLPTTRLVFTSAEPARSSKGMVNPGKEIAVTVVLSKDRNLAGWLLAFRGGQTVIGPLPVIAAIDAQFAKRAGNPEGHWRKPFGNIPTGRYQLLGLAAKGQVPLPTDEDTGSLPLLVLRAIDGEAALAEAAGRGDLLLHGGPNQPGLGTLRLSDADLGDFLDELQGAARVVFEISEQLPRANHKTIAPRLLSPSGAFPERRAAYVPRHQKGTVYSSNDTDLMDGFLLSYLIGWPTAPTPGAFWGAMLHGSSFHDNERGREFSQPLEDQSADRLRDIGIPVQDDEPPPARPVPSEQTSSDEHEPRRAAGHGNRAAEVDGAMQDTLDTPSAPVELEPTYVPTGGDYDR